MKTREVLLLTPSEIVSALTIEECIDAVEHAFRAYGQGKAGKPGVLSIHAGQGAFHVKAGALELGRSYFATKVNGNFPENPASAGLPTIQGIIVLCDARNGCPLAVMDSVEITALRTAAATAVAAKYLAREDAPVATIYGCGVQGRAQLRALTKVRRLSKAFAFDKNNEDQALRFARDLSEELGIAVTPIADPTAALRESQICVTCTPSRVPFVGPGDIAPGTFLCAVGADNPQKQELHPDLMAQNKVVVDSLEQCLVMGDLHHALDAGVMDRSAVHAELGEIVAGLKPGRTSEDEVIIFDSTGMALQDVAAAAIVFEKFARSGQGRWVDFAA